MPTSGIEPSFARRKATWYSLPTKFRAKIYAAAGCLIYPGSKRQRISPTRRRDSSRGEPKWRPRAAFWREVSPYQPDREPGMERVLLRVEEVFAFGVPELWIFSRQTRIMAITRQHIFESLTGNAPKPSIYWFDERTDSCSCAEQLWMRRPESHLSGRWRWQRIISARNAYDFR